MRVLLVPLLLSYARTVLGLPFIRDAIQSVVFASIPRNDGVPEAGSAEFWFHIVISIFLVLAGGVFSG
jgi:hypothetical protein